MKTVFIRAIEAPIDEKAAVIRAAVKGEGAARFEVDQRTLAQVPRSPFAYWTSDAIRVSFVEHARFESGGRVAKQGLATADDFRFVRLATEVPARSRGARWFSFAKGGAFSRFYADVYLLVDWDDDGTQIRHNLNDAGKVRSNVWMLRDTAANFFFRPGLTWPLRTNGLSFRVMPAACIFGHKGPAAFVDGDDSRQLLALAALLNSSAFGALVAMQLARTELAQSFEVGLIQQTPVPDLDGEQVAALAARAQRGWSLKRVPDTGTEKSHAFLLPALLQVDGDDFADRAQRWAQLLASTQAQLDALAAEIDDHAFRLYGLPAEDRQRIEQGFGTSSEVEAAPDDDGDEADQAAGVAEVDATPMVASLLSWTLGVAFGRFDVRLANGGREAPPEPEPFDPLPVCSPGMLTGDDCLPVVAPPAGYPLTFPTDGILVDDPGHQRDLLGAVHSVFEVTFDDVNARWHEAAELLGKSDLRTWFAYDFFEPHIRRYSRSRRKAPMYWQLATASGSYSIWLYIHRATADTLFRVLNDFVGPKLDHEKAKLERLTREAGGGPSASQRREIEQQATFVDELQALKAEVARVAPLWKPDLDDGVILNFAPLWRLVPQNRSWQSECKKAWENLVAGDYDWAHLAMHLWPERVVPKCVNDRSLAIAHGLEAAFWRETADGKWEPRKVAADEIAARVAERTSAAVKAALKSLMDAPAPASGAAGRGRGRSQQQRVPVPPPPQGIRASAQPQQGDPSAAVLQVLAAHPSGASKSDVVGALGLTDSQWSAVIKTLLANGSVTQTGERRGARYHAKRRNE